MPATHEAPFIRVLRARVCVRALPGVAAPLLFAPMRPLLTLALAGLVAIGCVSAPEAHATFDPAHDFARYETFALAAPPREGPAALPSYDLAAGERINRRIGEELRRKGLSEAPFEEADLVVSFLLAGEVRTDERRRPPREAGGDWYAVGWYEDDEYTVQYAVGTLVLDVFDRTAEELVWHGWSSVAIYSEEDAREKSADVVRAVLAGFPPQ
jgi:hypothetical protein